MRKILGYWKVWLLIVWLLGIWGWFSIGVPYFQRLPDDFSYHADIYSVDNLYDEQKGEFSGEILSKTRFSYDVIRSDGNVRIIKNIFDVRTPNGDPIFSVEREYGINADTRAHVPGYGDRDRTGFLFAPVDSRKQDFTYWHVNYDQPLSMAFESEEEILGLKVFRYSSSFTADQTANLTNLPEVGVTRGVVLDVTLTLWVEPITGRMIAYEDAADAFYYDLETGDRLVPWNSFGNRFISGSVAEQTYIAKQEIKYLYFLWGVGGVVGVLGVLLAFYFLPTRVWRTGIAGYFPLMVLILGLAATFFSWRFVQDFTEERVTYLFADEVDTVMDLINDRLDIYTNTLQGVRGLMEASDYVSRDEWKVFVDSLQVQRNYPGIQGVGYAVFILPEDLEDHIEELRAEGFDTYTVLPAGEREIYSAIVYLEPFDVRNQRAFGYDMFSNPIRRQAMEIARDTGKVTMSGKVTLVQETNTDVQAGFLLYLPLYEKNIELQSISDRQNHIIGYVYSPFRMNDFMRGALANQKVFMDVEIYDGDNRVDWSEERRMFDWNSEISAGSNEGWDLEEIRTLSIYNHDLTIRFVGLESHGLTIIETLSAELVLLVGGILSVLSAVVMYGLSSSRIRAISLAEEMTVNFKQKSEDLEEINRKLSEEVDVRARTEEELRRRSDELEKVNNVMIGRELKMVELKKKLEERNKNTT